MSLIQMIGPIYDLAQNVDNLSNLFTLSVSKIFIYLGFAAFTISLVVSLIWIIVSLFVSKKSFKIGLLILVVSLIGLICMIILMVLITLVASSITRL